MASQTLRLTALKLFGRFPKTEEVENKDRALREEYAEYLRFGQSEEYAHYLALKEYVESGEPLKVKNELNVLRFPNSEEHRKEIEFSKLKKNGSIRNYLRIKDSDILNQYKSIELSGKPTRYEELKQEVNTPEYRNNRKEHKKNNSNEYQHELEFHKLRVDADVKKYFKLKSWKPLKDYFELEGSDTVEQYYELEKYISSTEFIERKTYLLSKNKFEQTEAYQKLTEYNTLNKSEKIKWFLSLNNSKKFDEIKRWELTFSDDFEGNSLNTQTWLTRYFWGEALIHNSYSLAGDLHSNTNGKNIEVSNSIFKITTRKQQAEGIAWDGKYGFFPKTFEYTSGLVNTGQAFRQKYGRFEAKLKFTMMPNIYHAFWLVGDKMLPHIDVVRQNGKSKVKVQGSIFGVDGQSSKTRSIKSALNGFDFKNNFFILGIDWSPNKMVWTINGIPYMETNRYLPDSPAYLVFSSGVTAKANDDQLPATLEVDWVKCWKDTTTTSYS
ncbi:MAG: glycoside hydrolase family 16 protein [Tenuifilaceae bacterium]|jgi:beta-glucanase (GH16 family)|nr:glycoside hydrolase family 16 protein [Tenuifilaceae bacterium]